MTDRTSKTQLSGDLFTYCAARFATIALCAKDKGDTYIQRLAESAVEEMGRRVIDGTADETSRKPTRDADHCDYPDCESHWTNVVAQARALLEPLAECDPAIRQWLKTPNLPALKASPTPVSSNLDTLLQADIMKQVAIKDVEIERLTRENEGLRNQMRVLASVADVENAKKLVAHPSQVAIDFVDPTHSCECEHGFRPAKCPNTHCNERTGYAIADRLRDAPSPENGTCDPEAVRLRALIRRVLEWQPAFPVESGLLDDLADAIKGEDPEHGS